METTLLLKESARRSYILSKLRKHKISYHSPKTSTKYPKMVYVEWKTPADLEELFKTQIEKKQLKIQGQFIQTMIGV